MGATPAIRTISRAQMLGIEYFLDFAEGVGAINARKGPIITVRMPLPHWSFWPRNRLANKQMKIPLSGSDT